MPKPPISATLKWEGGFRFTAKTSRTEITIDGDSQAGPSPPEALAIALAGCMAIDVADIVIKGRHPLTALEASIVGRRVDNQPHRFEAFTLHFVVTGAVPEAAVDRAITLSHDKYCSVWHSLRGDIQLTTTFEVRP